MSTHNLFSSRNKKNIDTFWWKKAPIKSYDTELSQQHVKEPICTNLLFVMVCFTSLPIPVYVIASIDR